MPSAISVNMLGLRLTSDAQPRSKNGQPPQSTTGVASSKLQPVDVCGEIQPWTGSREMRPHGQQRAAAASATAPIQKRRVMSTSSGFGPSSAVGTSRAPAPCRRSGSCRARPARSRDASGRCRSRRRRPARLGCRDRRPSLGWRLCAEELRGIGAERFTAARAAEVVGRSPHGDGDVLAVAGSTVMPHTGSMAGCRCGVTLKIVRLLVA